MERGRYDEIKMPSLDERERKQVNELMQRAGSAEHVDEHGSWEFGCEFDRKGRGEALNWDLYGVGNDIHTGQFLMVIQVRKYAKQHKNWFPQIRKNYFLVGENEDGTVFAHSVESRVIFNAIRKDADVIRAVQNWIFNGEYDAMIRQGDIALLKMWETPRAAVIADTERTLLGSHVMRASKMRENGNLYVMNPTIDHPTHPQIKARGWYRVVIGQRADFWKFAAPTQD